MQHRLSEEFTVDPAEVARLIEETRLLLEGIGDHDEGHLERFVRDRLDARSILGDGPAKPAVIFVCVHNAGRSQMSAAWARHLAGDRLVVFAGGSDPGSEVNPQAVEAMAEVGIDISEAFPKPFTDDIVEASDVVVTMGCGDACPYFPGKRYIDWELPDPHGQPIEAVRVVRDEIGRNVEALLEEMLGSGS
ncbi:arsenate-mycothiol transferase ArsC1 [bacterium BMS3Abin02]|nr:arsenate-mycothiol transferase ArsC1 [bacterium BMS3Abin02]GBE22766.1 arsenate-mycothiol transferase ArsC1 [bacterium BMS3Bbin01]